MPQINAKSNEQNEPMHNAPEALKNPSNTLVKPSPVGTGSGISLSLPTSSKRLLIPIRVYPRLMKANATKD